MRQLFFCKKKALVFLNKLIAKSLKVYYSLWIVIKQSVMLIKLSGNETRKLNFITKFMILYKNFSFCKK